MRLSLIAAMAANRVIGTENKLPWHLPEDLKRFKAITSGHPVIMGRKTYESIGRLLPNRRNIIVTRQAGYQVPGADIAYSLDNALELGRAASSATGGEVFVIGGAEIYKQALPLADRMYLTLLERAVDGDAVFPEWSSSDWREVAREARTEPERLAFVTLERVLPVK